MMKNIQSVIYKIILIQDRIYIFEKANRTINKRYKAKKNPNLIKKNIQYTKRKYIIKC